MKLLDLCCGLGGWSKGFAAEGYECDGIDIINVGYPFNFINADVRDFTTTEKYDVITASPPCRDFTRLTALGNHLKWKDPPNPTRGMEIVNGCLRIINEVKPKFWILENVPGILKYFNKKPRYKVNLTKTMTRVFFGNFPDFLVPKTRRLPIQHIGGKLRSWKRAKIPFLVSNYLAKAIIGERVR